MIEPGPVIGTEQRIYLDANILIYAMETDGGYGTLARRWLMQIDRGLLRAVTSALTIPEVLPHPLSMGNDDLVRGYRRLLEDRPTLQVASVSSDILFRAAWLRAEFGSGTPDAIHVATALETRCTGFLTEDARLKLPADLRRYALADLMTADR